MLNLKSNLFKNIYFVKLNKNINYKYMERLKYELWDDSNI